MDHLRDIAERLAGDVTRLDAQARRLVLQARRQAWAEALALVEGAAARMRSGPTSGEKAVGWQACCAHLAEQIRGKAGES